MNCVNFSFAQEEWKNGHYYDTKGKLHTGLIKYEHNHKPSFTYKETESSKIKTIKSWKTKGFVIESDSFTVVKNFQLASGQRMAHDFAQVIEIGPIILLKNYSSITSAVSDGVNGHTVPLILSNITTYILTKPKSDKLWVVSNKKKEFKAIVNELISDFPQDSKYKNIDDLTYDMLPEIIKIYNSLN